jgi:hypothetical protein
MMASIYETVVWEKVYVFTKIRIFENNFITVFVLRALKAIPNASRATLLAKWNTL